MSHGGNDDVDHIQDSEEFEPYSDGSIIVGGRRILPSDPMFQTYAKDAYKAAPPVKDEKEVVVAEPSLSHVIAESIAKSDLGWTGFILVAPLALAGMVLILATAYWMAFGVPERCSRCGYNRAATWHGPAWTGPAEDGK